jgi:hypothetical protein
MSYSQLLRFGKNDVAQRPFVSAAWALAALSLFLLWQILTVHYNYSGNWTSLFLTGRDYTVPPELASGTYLFPGHGYDGEMDRYVAHDLFMQRGYARFMDGPAQRYHRILVPALAYLLVAGHQPWIDASYIAVVALFVFLGAYWLSRWAVLGDVHPAWALAFLLVPATLIAMDRMVVDGALAALTVAFALYWTSGKWSRLFIVLVWACLVRESGLLLVAGACLFELLNRRPARAALWACASLPMLAWYLFIRYRFIERTHYGVPVWFARRFGPGLFHHLLHPPRYPLSQFAEIVARSADVLALGAILLASLLALLLLRAQPLSPMAIAAVLFVVLVFTLTNAVYWKDVNGYARVLSPLLILVALPSIARKTRTGFPWWLGLVPPIVVDLRLGLQFTSAIGGVVRGLLHV